MNTMKRVLAATLSVLTVASPIGANVGVFLTEGATLVASAALNTGSYSADVRNGLSFNSQNFSGYRVGSLAVNDVLESGSTIIPVTSGGGEINRNVSIYVDTSWNQNNASNYTARINSSDDSYLTTYTHSWTTDKKYRVKSVTNTNDNNNNTKALRLVAVTDLTSANTAIEINNNQFDQNNKYITVKYNSTNIYSGSNSGSSADCKVTIKDKNGDQVTSINAAGTYTITAEGLGVYDGTVTQSVTVYSQDTREHEFRYAQLFPDETNNFAQFNINNGDTEKNASYFTLYLSGTDNSNHMNFGVNDPVTIVAPKGKLISSIEFIAPEQLNPVTDQYTLEGASTLATTAISATSSKLIVRNVVSEALTITPQTNKNTNKFTEVRVYYVTPIALSKSNVTAANLFYSPDTDKYPLNPLFFNNGVTGAGTGNDQFAEFQAVTDYNFTVKDSKGNEVDLSAMLGTQLENCVASADTYTVTVTGNGVFTGSMDFEWTVAKYALDFTQGAGEGFNYVANPNYNARLNNPEDSFGYTVAAKDGVANPETAADYECKTKSYNTGLQVKKRSIYDGSLYDGSVADNWVALEKGADKDFIIVENAANANINTMTSGDLSTAVNASGTSNYTATITGVNNFTGGDTDDWTITKATLANTNTITRYNAPTSTVTNENPLYYTGNNDEDKKPLANAGTFADFIKVPTNEDGTAIQGIEAPKFQYKLSTDTNWSDSIPTEKGNAGVDTTYTVQYRIVGGTNYNDISATQQNPMSFNVAIIRKPSTITLTGLDSEANPAILVKTKENGNGIPENMQKAETVNGDGAFDVKAGDEYKLYTDLTVAEDSIVNKSYITAQTFNQVEYGYCYTIKVPDVPSDDGYTLSHSYATMVISAYDNSDVRDKAYVRDNGQVKPVTAIVAEFKSNTGVDGLGKQYYYGNAPTINDVLTYDKLGATVEKEDFYFYLASDTEQKTRLNANQLEAGNTYIVRADVPVTLSNGTKTQAYIEKEIEYVARPLAECQVYLADEKGNETELAVVNNAVTISKNTFTYNKNEQKPNIVIKSPAYDANNLPIIVTLEDTDLTDNIEAKKNAGQYTGTLTGESPNFTGELTVNWSIAQAENRMTIEPKDGVVYDGELLDINDFSVTDPDNILTEENPTILVTPNETNGSTLKYAGAGQSGTVTVSCANYIQERFNLENVNINKRSINATPDVNQSTVYGVKAGNINYVLEDANGVRGLVAADKNDADLRDKAVLIGNYDYNDVMENDAGEYTYVGNETLANYNVEIVGANTNKFTVTQKDISDFIVILNPITVDENGDWLAKQDTDEKLGDYYYYTYDGETNFEVEVALIISNDAPDYTYILDGDDYILGGATRRITANSDSEPFYFVQAEGKGNYKGIAKAPWQVRGQGVEGLSLTINGGEVANDAKTVTYNGKAIETDFAYNGNDPSFEANITDVTYEFYEGTTKLQGAPKNAGTYTVKATVSATGYRDSELTCTLTIAPATLNLAEADAAKTIQYGTDENLKYDEYGKAFYPLTVDDIDNIDGFVDADRALVMQAVEGGKFAFDWQKKPNTTRQYVSTISWNQKDGTNTVAYLGEDLFAVLNRNYDWDNVNYTLKVTPKPISRDDVEIIYDASSILGDNVDENGYTYNKVKVIDHTTGQTLVEGVDYVVNNNGTKEAGQFRIEVVGQENYCSYVRKDWKVTKDVTGIYTFIPQDPWVAINPQNKGIYVKLGFEGEIEYSNYRVKEYGVIYNNKGTATLDELRLDNPELNEDTTKNGRINVLRNKNGVNVRDYGKGVTATGYVILEDKNNPENVHVAYTDFNIGGDTYVCNEYAPQGVTNAGKKYIKVMYEGNIYKKGYSLVEYGLIYNNTGEATVADLTLDNVDGEKIIRIQDKNGGNIPDNGKGVAVVGYMIIKNEDNQQAVIYTNDLGGKYAELANLH
jgi:hypothetical protein